MNIWRFIAVTILMGGVGLSAAETDMSVVEQTAKCVHGASLYQPNVCCVPRDGYFNDLIVDGDLTVNGTAFLGDLIINGTITGDVIFTGSLTIQQDLLVNGSACVEGLTNLNRAVVDNTLYSGYFSDINTGLLNDSHKEIFSLFDQTDTITTLSVGALGVVVDDMGSYAVVNDQNGYSRVFGRNNDTWQFLQELVLSNTLLRARKSAISADGSRIATWTSDDGIVGTATIVIFTHVGNTWVEEASVLLGSEFISGVFFSALSLSGDGSHVLAGPIDMGDGTVRYFYLTRASATCSQTPAAWNITQTFDGPADSFPGLEVNLSRNGLVALIGTPFINSNAGAVQVYTRDALDDLFTFIQTIQDAVPQPGSDFGVSNAISANGDYLIIGSPGYSGSQSGQGAAYVFMRVNNQWVQQQQITLPAPIPGEAFGSSVQISADGTFAEISTTDAAGSIYIAMRSASAWNIAQTLSPAGGLSNLTNKVALSKDQSFLLAVDDGNSLVSAYSPGCAVVPTCLQLPGGTLEPMLTFIGDTNTGIYSIDPGQINFATNGQDRINIDFAGNGSVTEYSKYNVNASTSGAIYGPGLHTIVFGTVQPNPPSPLPAYNSATGVYTAPVTGAYFVQALVNVEPDGSSIAPIPVELTINGASGLTQPLVAVTLIDTTDMRSLLVTALVDLTLGDAISIQFNNLSGTDSVILFSGSRLAINFMSF